jgi:hypothetical protein
LGLKQLVQVNHHIFHFGIVHGALCSGAPRIFRSSVIGKKAYNFHGIKVNEIQTLGVGNAATENKVKLAHYFILAKRLKHGA